MFNVQGYEKTDNALTVRCMGNVIVPQIFPSLLHLQVNLRKITKVTAIATQGRQDYAQWVKTYKICYGQKLDGYCELLDQVTRKYAILKVVL